MSYQILLPSEKPESGIEYSAVSSSGKYALSFGVINKRSKSFITASLTDFETKEKLMFREPSRVASKIMGKLLPADDGGVRYKSEYCDFAIEKASCGVRFKCNYKKCYFHSDFEADIAVFMPEYTVNTPLDGRVMLCCPFSGTVKVCGREYSFNKDCDLGTVITSGGSELCASEGARVTASWVTDKKPFGCCFSETEGVCVIGDTVYELKTLNTAVPDNAIDKWVVRGSDDAFKAELAPFFNDREDRGILSSPRYTDGLYCTLSGSAFSLMLDGTKAYCEYTHKKF